MKIMIAFAACVYLSACTVVIGSDNHVTGVVVPYSEVE